MLYRLALGSGLRAGELLSLTPESFCLDDGCVLVKAGSTKNKVEARQPLPADLVHDLRTYLAQKPAGQAIWRQFPGKQHRWCSMLQADMAAARSQWLSSRPIEEDRHVVRDVSEGTFLAYQTAAGYADFHSLRHTYITLLAHAGVHPRKAQELARHSDINLTMKVYTRLTLADAAAALAQVPALLETLPTPAGDVSGTCERPSARTA